MMKSLQQAIDPAMLKQVGGMGNLMNMVKQMQEGGGLEGMNEMMANMMGGAGGGGMPNMQQM
jgi:signal recognition particle subunit SRP54